MSEANQQPPPYPPYPYYPQEEDELSLIDLWNIVWRRKWLWLTLGPLAGVLGIFYALNAPVYYKAEATLAPSNEEKSGGGLAALAGQFGGLASMAGIDFGGGGSTDNALAVLKSRQFLAPFLTQEERLKALFPNQWDEGTQQWTVAKERRGEDNRPTKQEAYDRFTNGILSVSQDKKSGIVTVALEMQDPKLASAWTNELIATLNEHLRKQALAEASKNLEYLNEQLSKTKVLEIREALYTLIESQTKNAMLANAKKDYAFKIIDPAVTPEVKSKPKRGLIVIASGMLGGFLGLFLCFVFHFVETAKKSKSS
ncbi:Wzz/FepE/Etk N-terminal domain-containing protein [Pelagicoccus sp. SDUM812003]|uniref:Wzz/FepE/Etk N-terminal domain-containing protein n=1 Tax=Pelagicoccus sp. SDUM812003 TaxID=3041267 RepID=UPI00280F1716|nr:Wzz/FepE/Etk N-terminal domain-containing protein [Pelagicoccus sp. SDUM812003]MDQ8205640.1 Wzz/FepE/Etk N-terminal domain-containing protein [Pelagicoccus sp. SDUM812003]